MLLVTMAPPLPQDAPLDSSDLSPDDVWVVVAAYNEAPRLGATLDRLCRRFAHVVVVDDGSVDDTAAVAQRRPVWLLRHIINRGQGASLQTGIEFALQRGAQIVATFDADGQHSESDLARLIEPVRSGEVEVALGSRFLGATVNMPASRWLLLKGAVAFTRLFSRIHVTDTHNGLRAFSRSAAQQIRITLDRMEHASEILDQIRHHGLTFREVPVTIHYSEQTLSKGQSSWNSLRIAGKLMMARLLH